MSLLEHSVLGGLLLVRSLQLVFAHPDGNAGPCRGVINIFNLFPVGVFFLGYLGRSDAGGERDDQQDTGRKGTDEMQEMGRACRQNISCPSSSQAPFEISLAPGAMSAAN